ncbi:MAG: EamA family transporter, partial [Candidatus Levyibacteriota bacterium]
MWLSFTMLAAALWGVGQVFTKKGLEHTSPLFNNSIAAVVILVSTVPFALYHGVQFSLLPSIFLLTFFSALFMLSYYYIIGEGKISLTGTIMAMYPVVPIILSFVFLHEHPGIIQKFAGILVLVGTGVIAYGQEKTMKRFKLGRWFWLAIFCAIITGFGDFLSKLAINVSDAYT